MGTKQTVFLVDDDDACRDSTAALIMAMGFQCESFGSAEAFLDEYDPSVSGCLVADMGLPGMSGIELQKEMQRRHWSLPCILVTGLIEVPEVVHAIKQGAETVLRKPSREQDLRDAIQGAMRRDAQHRVDEAHRDALRQSFTALTESERRVLDLVIQGSPNKAIAKKLNVSMRTVEERRSRVMRKLGVNSLATLIKKAYEAGWDPTDES